MFWWWILRKYAIKNKRIKSQGTCNWTKIDIQGFFLDKIYYIISLPKGIRYFSVNLKTDWGTKLCWMLSLKKSISINNNLESSVKFEENYFILRLNLPKIIWIFWAVDNFKFKHQEVGYHALRRTYRLLRAPVYIGLD